MSKLRTRLSPEERRKQLIHSAIVCYGEMGVERAGHGDVAKHAGVSTATVFNYFGTRESLTEAVFGAVYDLFRVMFETIPKPGDTPAQHLQHLAVSYNILAGQHSDVLKVALNWAASYGDGVRPQYLEFQDWVLKGIQSRLEQAGENTDDARIVLAAAYTYASMKLDNTPDTVLMRYAARVMKAIA